MDNAVYVRGQVRETCIALFTLHARLSLFSLSLSLGNDLATYEKGPFLLSAIDSTRCDKMYALFVYQEVRSS